VLYEIPEVVEVAVVGVPEKRRGETRVVVLDDGANLTLPKLTDYCCDRLRVFEIPKRLVISTLFRTTHSAKCSSACCAANSEPAHEGEVHSCPLTRLRSSIASSALRGPNAGY
jgi:acyl-CoA synthetase (AMP-forming)/AMP-acid ligase II